MKRKSHDSKPVCEIDVETYFATDQRDIDKINHAKVPKKDLSKMVRIIDGKNTYFFDPNDTARIAKMNDRIAAKKAQKEEELKRIALYDKRMEELELKRQRIELGRLKHGKTNHSRPTENIKYF